MHALTLTLPIVPLPLSQCFANKRRGRYSTPEYIEWQKTADAYLVKHHAYALGIPKRPTIKGKVRVNIMVKRPDRRRRDLDNLGKASLDLLVRNYVIEDDSLITDLRIRWDDEISHKTVIEVEAA